MSPTIERALDVDFVARMNRPGPRYTSYPTVPHWVEADSDVPWVQRVRALDEPVSVYVHCPFCKEQCSFCGCNMVVAGRREPGQRTLKALKTQVEALAVRDVPTGRLHLGGGTPTWYTAEELHELFEVVTSRFGLLPDAEVSVEVDPEVTTHQHLVALAKVGTTRLSVGIQSFDPVVLRSVNRFQDPEHTKALVQDARSLGISNINVDLMVGLPHQSPETLAATIEHVLRLGPDRLAVYSYAHVPWMKAHQRKIDEDALPQGVDKMRLILLAHELLTRAGHQHIGMDHYALEDDELSVAQRNGTLHRNFMGYTTRGELPLVGLGPSAISEFPDLYTQQQPKLATWWKAVEDGGVVTHRICHVSKEDQLRRATIRELMCHMKLPSSRFFEDVRPDLKALEDEGLVALESDGLTVSTLGRHFVRNVAMVFDAHLKEGPGRYSKTV